MSTMQCLNPKITYNNPDSFTKLLTRATTEISNRFYSEYSNKIRKTAYNINDNVSDTFKKIVITFSQGSDFMDVRTLQNLKKLEYFKEMSYNWNDNGAEPFSQSLIEKCKDLLNILPKQPEIFPTAAKSIQFEYDNDNGDYLEFNVYDEHIEIFQIINDEESESVLNIRQKSNLQKIVSDFYG